jgi:hypothetical protein
MKIEVVEHACTDCNRYFITADTEIEHTYYATCRTCLQNKIFLLEEKINFLYGYFQATNNMRIK